MDLSATYSWIPGLAGDPNPTSNQNNKLNNPDTEPNTKPINPINYNPDTKPINPTNNQPNPTHTKPEQRSLDTINQETNKNTQKQLKTELTHPSNSNATSNIKEKTNDNEPTNPVDLSLFWGFNAINHVITDDKIKSKEVELVDQVVIAVASDSNIIPDEEFHNVTLTEDVVKIIKPFEKVEPKPLFDRILSTFLPESAAVILVYIFIITLSLFIFTIITIHYYHYYCSLLLLLLSKH